MIEFGALGGLTISEGDREVAIGGPRQRRLVAMLLIHRNTVVSVDGLADAVFAGEPTPAASTTLRSYVARMRRSMADDAPEGAAVVTLAPGYMLKVPTEAFDVARFERLLADGRAQWGREDAAAAAASLGEALALWRGDAYAEFADEEWARPEAQRLGELRLAAWEQLLAAELACGRAVEVVPQLEALAAEHPLREGFRTQLVIAYYRTGRQADALAVVRSYRHVLVEELGLDPSPALTELERRVLQHDATLLLPEPEGRPLRGYRLHERLGTGRDGTVYVARLAGVNRDVAVRVVRADLADGAGFVRSFEGAAHRVASLRHPAAVAIHDYWREPGAAYVVMRRMGGGTLRDRLHRGPLTAAEATALVVRIGGCLVAAAERHIEHGRVVPESVLFDTAGDAFLSDFTLCAGGSEPACGGDVHDFAVLVDECLGGAGGAVGAVLARAMSPLERLAMDEFVPLVLTALAAEIRPTGPVRNPYKALRAFEEADAGDFFGRAVLVDELIARLGDDRTDRRGRLVLVVGGSGSGKSSAVRAGLLPRLRRGDVPGSATWFVATMVPGSSPFAQLADCLRGVSVSGAVGSAEQLAAEGGIDAVLRRIVPGAGQLLLVVDQLEELFTMAADHEQRAFLGGLVHAVTAPDARLRVVAALRADFYDRPLAVPGFGAAVNEATLTIAAMSPADVEAAIVGPAAVVGAHVERALVAELVAAVIDAPAALPSLQFTLYELAERSPDRSLTLDVYRALGGVEGAVASRAELLYESLDDGGRSVVRRLFEQLVIVAPDGPPTRRRAARAELVGAADVPLDDVIDGWAKARLLTLDRHPRSRVPTVELAHEALLRAWPRLGHWIDEDREALLSIAHLRDAASSWVELGRDHGALYRGTRLAAAEDAAERRPLPALAQEFLDASRGERDRAEEAERHRVERQVRANRRLRLQLAAIVVALVVALAGGLVALDQRRHADHESRIAVGRELAAASVANLGDDPQRSVLLALAAVDSTRGRDGSTLPEAEEALHRAVTASRVVLDVDGVGGRLDWSADGRLFVTEGPEDSGLVDLRDAATGKSLRTFHGNDVDINDVAFAPSGSMVVTTGDDGAARAFDVATGRPLWTVRGDVEGPVFGPSFSGDGTRLVVSFDAEASVRVIDAATGDVVTELDAPQEFGDAISPAGESVALVEENAVRVLDAESGEQLQELEPIDDFRINSVAWSPDGRSVVAGGGDGTLRVWSAATGEVALTLSAHAGGIAAVVWGPGSDVVATAGDDGTARVFDVAGSGRELLRFAAQELRGGAADVAFSPAGDRLMVGDAGARTVLVFDVGPGGGSEWSNIVAPGGVPGGLAFLPDGRTLVSSTVDGVAALWDTTTGESTDVLGVGLPAAVLEPSPDGSAIAAASDLGYPLDIWDTSTGERQVLAVQGDDDDFVFATAWSPDGRLLAMSHGDDNEVSIVDRAGAVVGTLPNEDGGFYGSLAFDSSDRLLATARARFDRPDPAFSQVSIWEWRTGTSVRDIPTSAYALALDPQGTRVATARNQEGIVDVWDIATGESVTVLTGHSSPVLDVTFSADGSRLATASGDGTARVWDAATGAPLVVLRGEEGRLGKVAFSPDGSRLATESTDGTVRVWALDLDDLIRIAERRLARGLSDAECRQYLHIEACPAP